MPAASVKSKPYAAGIHSAQEVKAERTILGKLMLRISEHCHEGQVVRVRLDGTLTTDSYADLEATLSRHQNNGKAMILLDMAGVGFMNGEVARKLGPLRAEGIKIINCSPFIEMLLSTV